MALNGSNNLNFDEHRVERLILGFRFSALAILLVGIGVACVTGVERWIERSGHLLVAGSLFLTYLQFRYESHFSNRYRTAALRAEQLAAEKYIPVEEARRVIDEAARNLNARFEAVRHTVLVNAVISAAAGELIAAFGDLAFSVFLKTATR